MLRPVIMIGCGGSGQKAVRYVRDSVRRRLEHSGWTDGVPQAWQFLGLDTLNVQESPGEIPPMPAEDYQSIALQFGTFSELDAALTARHTPQERKGYRELIGWRPRPDHVEVPLRGGAGQMRAVGRTAGVVSLATVVRPRLSAAFTDCDAGGPELQRVSEHLNVPVPAGTEVPDPMVVVLGSMAGGTGAGILLDVVDLVRRTDKRGAFPIAVIFTPDIFRAAGNDAMAANGLAMMSELMSAYWDDEMSHAHLIPNAVVVDNRGPHATFLIGRKNLRGIDLDNSRNVYRAVGETLASWVASANVQESIYNFITVNWPMYAPDNMGGYQFDRVRQRGVVSSFGSATISIGRDRFREYTAKLLVREVLQGLYDGHARKATIELGPDSKNLTDAAILAALLERHRLAFLQACLLDEKGTEANQITDRFASKELGAQELRSIKEELQFPFGTQTGSPGDWYTRLNAQAFQVARISQERSLAGFDKILSDWGPEIFENILKVTTDYIGRYGLKLTGELVQASMTEVAQVAAEVRQEAHDDQIKATQLKEEAKSTLRNAGTDGSLNFAAGPVQAAFDSFAKAIVNDWRADRRERTADAIESLSNEVLTTLNAQIAQAHGRVHELVTSVEGRPALVEGWPEYGVGVPESFLPSPLEFFLEEVDGWPGALQELAREATELAQDQGYQTSNSIDATRFLVVAGGYQASQHADVSPLAWVSGPGSQAPQWVPGSQAAIEVAGDAESVRHRVNAWMGRPSSPMSRHFNEGLRWYLNSTDRTGQPVPDHAARLTAFRQKLNEAKNQSEPLVELDSALNAVIHPDHPSLAQKPLAQGFPFPLGHPAREVVAGLLGEDSHFTDSDRESVLLSSFLEYPVHPMIVTSFTQPLGDTLTAIGNDNARLRGAFWLWRRTKVLEDFVPIPDETRLSIIRGFAVARMLGYITADPTRPVSLTSTRGPLRFPFPLLTEVTPDNILPALLESFALCFGSVAVEHQRAFDAYDRLFRLGEGTGHLYTLHEEAETFLREGVLPFTAEDPVRHERARGATEEERSQKLREYIETNIRRYEQLEERQFTGQEWRDKVGAVSPPDTMTIELIEDLKSAYHEVLNALITRTTGGVV